MLRVAKVRPGGHAYFLEVAGERGTAIEAPGRWLSAGASELGLSGNVSAASLAAVLAGDHPLTGERVAVAHDRVRVAAFDLTFCAPKSVSLLHALGESDVSAQVGAAHGTAVRAALAYIEERAAAVRRRADGIAVPVTASAVAAAAFTHRVSRALDPHLHTHVVVANLGRGPEGRFTALDGRGLYAHAAAGGARYHAQLRHDLTRRLGVAWGPPSTGRADIEGIDIEMRRAFSARAAAIAEHLAARGLGGRRARDIAAHATRQSRDVRLSADDLRPWWRSRARSLGLGPRHLGMVVDRVPRRAGPEPHTSHDVVVARELLKRGSAVSRRDVVRAWCSSLPVGASARSVADATDRMLITFPVAARYADRHDGPGVAERRHELEGPVVERARSSRTLCAAREHGALRSLLAARGMVIDEAPRRGRDRDRTSDVGMAIDGAMGMG